MTYSRRRQGAGSRAGFSLLELMIAVAIVGILSAIALPAYQRSVLAAGRSEEQILLMQAASRQERLYSDNNRYSDNADPLASPVMPCLVSETGLYQVTVAPCTGGSISHCFVATATAQGAQAA